MRLAATLLLPLVAIAQAQSTPAKKQAVHRATTATTAGTLPPNIPKVVGLSKPLYSLKYIDTKVGTGELATPQKFYTVHYTGWLAKDGTKFDSSFDHPDKQPITFPYGAHRVIPGWDTGFEGMKIGGKRRLFIPWQLAYGDAGRPPVIPAKADLIFDIELVTISDKPPAPPVAPEPPKQAPEPAAKPDASATPDPKKPNTDPAENDPAKATTPDNAAKPAPKPTPPNL